MIDRFGDNLFFYLIIIFIDKMSACVRSCDAWMILSNDTRKIYFFLNYDKRHTKIDTENSLITVKKLDYFYYIVCSLVYYVEYKKILNDMILIIFHIVQ